MKKVIVFLLSSIFLASCGATDEIEELSSELEEARRYEYAMVLLPSGETVEGEIDDYFTSLGGFKIIFKNGETYLTSLENVVLMKEVHHENR